jgi:uncharacterized membrane protein
MTIRRGPRRSAARSRDSSVYGLQVLNAIVVIRRQGGLTAVAMRRLGIDEGFLGDVKDLIKPGSSALFLETRTDNPEAVLRNIEGLGGTVLKTNANPDLARLVQESLHPTGPTS